MSENVEHIEGAEIDPNEALKTMFGALVHHHATSADVARRTVSGNPKDRTGTNAVAQFCLAHRIDIKTVLGDVLGKDDRVRIIDRGEHEVVNPGEVITQRANPAKLKILRKLVGEVEAEIGKLLGSEQSTDDNRVALHGSQPTGGDEAIGG